MVGAVFDINEVDCLRGGQRQRPISLALLLAIVLHLLLALAVTGQLKTDVPDSGAQAIQSPLQATLIVVAEPLPLMQSPVNHSSPLTTTPVAPERMAPVVTPTSTSTSTQALLAPAKAVSQPSVFQESGSLLNESDENAVVAAAGPMTASEIKDPGVVQPPYTPPSSQIAYGENPKPNYPMAVRDRGIEGVVELLVVVDERGAPSVVRIKNSSGFAVLDREALKAVLRWRFMPAQRGGVAVSGEVVVPVRFQLTTS